VPIVLKSGSLNHLGPSGPVKACNGIALPFLVFHNYLNLTNGIIRRTSGRSMGTFEQNSALWYLGALDKNVKKSIKDFK
jgi:hypothetical protein